MNAALIYSCFVNTYHACDTALICTIKISFHPNKRNITLIITTVIIGTQYMVTLAVVKNQSTFVAQVFTLIMYTCHSIKTQTTRNNSDELK